MTDSYVAAHLAEPEADDFKSAGVLLYCFDRGMGEPVALLARERRADRNLLGFIGGKRDRRETARATAAREVGEETCNQILPEDLQLIKSSPEACSTVLWADFAKYALFVHQLPDHYADLPTRVSGMDIARHSGDSNLLGIESHPFKLLFDDKWLNENFHHFASRMVRFLRDDLSRRIGLGRLPQNPPVVARPDPPVGAGGRPKPKKGAGRGKFNPSQPSAIPEPGVVKFTITLSPNQPAAVPCRYFNSSSGCRAGESCVFAHVTLDEIDPKGIRLDRLEPPLPIRKGPFDLPAGKQTGSCKWFDADKGFGFIVPDSGHDDIFVRTVRYGIQAEGSRKLVDGEKVAHRRHVCTPLNQGAHAFYNAFNRLSTHRLPRSAANCSHCSN